MRITAIRLSFIALAAASIGPAATLRSLMNEGNQRYEVEEYDEALKSYRLAAEQAPDSHHAHFNLGAALYRTGEYGQAIGAFQQAAQVARENGDPSAEALSRYNLGNSFFRASEADAQTNPRQAIATLEKGVESYRQALQLDPKLADAEHNIALARRKMKELLDQMRNAPPGGDSQEGQEQLKDQIEQNLREQKELSDKREQLEQQQNQQDRQDQAQQLAKEQQQLEQKARDLAKQLDKAQPTPQEQQAREHLEQAAQQQQQASQQLAQQQMQQAGGSQQQAQQRLEDALTSLGGDPQKTEPSSNSQQSGASQQQQPSQRLQALEHSPQDILNEERANRQRRRMLMLGAQAQVEKDW